MSQRRTCVELINVTLLTIAIICFNVLNLCFLFFYVPIKSTKSQLSKLIACIKVINLTIIVPLKFLPFFPSHITSNRKIWPKRGNRGAGYHETKKLLNVCTLSL